MVGNQYTREDKTLAKIAKTPRSPRECEEAVDRRGLPMLPTPAVAVSGLARKSNSFLGVLGVLAALALIFVSNVPSMTIRLLTDHALLADCRTDLYRGSGPGGQKRNKTSNAVRLTHLPTGVHVTATESRSLALNKLHALRRLRIKLAAEIREPIDLLTFSPPDWFLEIRHNGKITASHRHPQYTACGGLLLDLFDALRASPSAVGVNLGVPTTTVIRFLETEPAFWAAANQIRKREGLAVLNRHGRR